MIFRRSLAMAAALGLLGATAEAQHHTTGSNPIPNANNPLPRPTAFGTGYNNPLSQGVGFGTGYNNPLTKGSGSAPVQQPAQPGRASVGYNDPLLRCGRQLGDRAAINPSIGPGFRLPHGSARATR